MKRSIPLVLAALVLWSSSVSSQAQPSSPRASDALRCALVATSSGREWSLSFELHNRNAPTTLRYFEPIVPSEVSARAGNLAVSIEQPALDLGVRSVERVLAPNEHVTLRSPIRLRFGVSTGAVTPNTDRFLWTLAHAPVAVQLRAAVGEGASRVVCNGTLTP